MKFSEMPYTRPDPEAVKAELQRLTGRLRSADSYETARAVFLEKEEEAKKRAEIAQRAEIARRASIAAMAY